MLKLSLYRRLCVGCGKHEWNFRRHWKAPLAFFDRFRPVQHRCLLR